MQLPFVLAGPIVRRARPDQVLIWIAVSKDVFIGGEVYRTKKQGEGYEVDTAYPIGEGTSGKRIWLGAGVWVHLIELLPNDRAKDGVFPAREILAYDLLGRDHPLRPIRVRSSDNQLRTIPQTATPERRKQQLKARPAVMSARLESNGERLKKFPGVSIQDYCLPGFDLPTFVLQEPGRRDLTAFYASCRKPHGSGSDAARLLESRLTSVASQPASRPSALFLTGDQIYADDVHDELIGFLTTMGDLAKNGQEPLPDVKERLDQPKQRAKVVKDVAGFTSSEGGNHALRCSEFQMLYLLAWNPAMWPPVNDKKLLEGKAGSAAMRRVLANVPTYMGFDDHEVTDDWNLNEPWRTKVGKSALGTRVMANALAAYAAFQALGNAPESVESLMPLIENRMENPGIDGGLDQQYETTLLGFRFWQFATPTVPRTLFLDTRTSRGPSSATDDWMWHAMRGPHGATAMVKSRKARKNSPPLLMTPDLARLAASLVGNVKGQPLVLVAPAPVLQVEMVEDLAAISNFWEGPAKRDFEGWHANHESFIRLFTDLVGPLQPSACVILSGDVHFAQVTSATMETVDGKLPVLQLTSSALKNQVDFTLFFDIVRNRRKMVRRRLWWMRPSGEVVWLDAEFDLPAEERKEADLRAEFTEAPHVIETSESLDLGVGKMTNILDFSNIGVLTVRADIESQIYAIDGNSTYMSSTFKV